MKKFIKRFWEESKPTLFPIGIFPNISLIFTTIMLGESLPWQFYMVVPIFLISIWFIINLIITLIFK